MSEQELICSASGEVIGDRRLCAWRTSETSCRIQTNNREIAKQLSRLPDVARVAYSVSGSYLQAFALPYTLEWVKENVIEKFASLFPKKFGGDFSGKRNSARFETAPGQWTCDSPSRQAGR